MIISFQIFLTSLFHQPHHGWPVHHWHPHFIPNWHDDYHDGYHPHHPHHRHQTTKPPKRRKHTTTKRPTRKHPTRKHPTTKPTNRLRKHLSELIPRNCAYVVKPMEDVEGVFKIYVEETTFDVYCIPDPESGPAWTIIQRRMDGSVDFFRNWMEYVKGFGDIDGEYWLGLKKMHYLTNSMEYELWVQITDFENETRTAKYGTFYVGDATDRFNLGVDNYYGNAGDSLTIHNGMKFSTYDNDHDSNRNINCAKKYKGGWWMKNCHDCNLNGDYRRHADYGQSGIKWKTFKNFTALKYAHMAIRPAKFAKHHN